MIVLKSVLFFSFNCHYSFSIGLRTSLFHLPVSEMITSNPLSKQQPVICLKHNRSHILPLCFQAQVRILSHFSYFTGTWSLVITPRNISSLATLPLILYQPHRTRGFQIILCSHMSGLCIYNAFLF